MSPHILLGSVLQSTTEHGLTMRRLFESLPRDPASIVALVLLVLCTVMALWLGTRSKGKGRRSA